MIQMLETDIARKCLAWIWRVPARTEFTSSARSADTEVTPDRLALWRDASRSRPTSVSRENSGVPIPVPGDSTGSAEDAFVELNRLAAIVAGSDDAIMSKTLDGLITSWNNGAERIFGYRADEMIGQPITKIIPPELHIEEFAILAALSRGEHIDHFETVRLAKDGRRVDVSLTVSPLYDASGQVVGASKIARDICKRRAADAALLEATIVADHARAEAEGANRAKTEFLAVMSHEIRTPLTSISGFIDLLAQKGRLTREQRRYVRLVRAASSALLTIVNDILDFSKVEAGTLELDIQPFNLNDLLQEAIAITEPTASLKSVALNVMIDPSVPAWLYGDAVRLRQVILNLLSNAVKFTPAGSVTIRVGPSLKGGDERIHFSICDTGIGIPADQQSLLFQSFVQGDASVGRRYGGTGLGLAICKRLVGLMGGEIGILSKAAEGTTVWFTADLPCSDWRRDGNLGLQEPANTASSGRILVVDDIDMNREIVAAYLEDYGFEVRTAESATEAIDLLGRSAFDLVLMDIQMPGMDGITATRRIRAREAPVNAIPIVAMTGNVLPHQIKSFLEAGMTDHVGKPIERAKLFNTVKRWLPRAEISSAPAPDASPQFNRLTFEELVNHLGADIVHRTAARFRDHLAGCFRMTPADSRREAHDLLNMAGVLGFDRLVELCRDLATIPLDASARQQVAIGAIRQSQAHAHRMLADTLLPELEIRMAAMSHLHAGIPAHYSRMEH